MSHPGVTGKRPRRVDRQQVEADVLRGLATGLPLSVIARRNGTSQQLVDYWAKGDPALAEALAEARSLGWDSLAVQCLEIADDRSGDVLYDTEGNPHPNSANVLSRKLAIETRLRLLSRWDSGRYGESAKLLRVEGEVTTTTRHVLDVRQLDPASRDALRALLDHAAAQGLLPGPQPVDAEYEEVEAEPDE